MNSHEPQLEASRQRRRDFIAGAAVGVFGGAAAAWAAWEMLARGQATIVPSAEERWQWEMRAARASSPLLGIPGPWPGRVIEVHHPGAVKDAKRDRGAVKAMIARGMRELVGSDDDTQAWRYMFKPGDRVGIKVVPVGQPLSISSFEVVLETIAGLQSAGVRRSDIMVFERYKNEFLNVGYHRILPAGVHWECSSAYYTNGQLEIDGQVPDRPRESHIAGYDRDVYREEPYCDPDPKSHPVDDDRRYRSHLSTIITRKIDKFISIPVLKDHRSAGVTLSLKNLSHGSVNNVARSHIGNPAFALGREEAWGTANQCNQFIPSMVSLPQIREKAVLQILDGLVGTYEGGPGNWNRTFATWEYGSLFFATDPVALDRVGWEIIDEKRASVGMPPVARMGLDAVVGTDGSPAEGFHIRQPQHVPLAATLGLGLFERKRIEHRKVELA